MKTSNEFKDTPAKPARNLELLQEKFLNEHRNIVMFILGLPSTSKRNVLHPHAQR